MPDDEINALIREIAEKHNIAVGRNDPILVLHTINERLAKNSAASQEMLLTQFRQELEVVANQWSQDAKEKAERILSAALNASQDAMKKLLREGAETANKALRQENLEFQKSLTTQVRAISRIAWLNAGTAAMLLVGAVSLCLIIL
jgi:hypothetical protein